MEGLGIRELLDNNPIAGPPRRGPRRFWTGAEIKIMRAKFPNGGVEACVEALPGRSASSIYQRAAILELLPIQQKGAVPRQRWFSSPQIDAAIIRVFQGAPREGEVKALAKTLMRPKWWVGKRALALGLKTPRFKEPPWTQPELDFIAEHAERHPETLSKNLKKLGFNRTATAIVVKLKRLGQPRGRNADVSHYTANHLAKLFGIDLHTVLAWIGKGWLRAKRRGPLSDGAGDGSWWVHHRDVRAFVVDNVAAVDIRKVEKFWFVDLLANKKEPGA